MRRGFTLAVACGVLAAAACVWAFAEPEPADTSPWHVGRVARTDQARDDANSATPPAGPQKYLHVRVDLRVPPDLQKMHKFRVTDSRGRQVGELYGYHKDKSVLVFEGSWSNLDGLYLEGLAHREPLFARAPAPVEPRTPVVVERPQVMPAPPTQPIVVPPPERVLVEEPRPGPVIVERPGPDRVIVPQPGPDRVIVREPGPDRVVIRDGGTRVVGPDQVVIRDGGTRVIGGPDRVIVRDGGAQVVGPDRVVVQGHGPRTLFVDGTGGRVVDLEGNRGVVIGGRGVVAGGPGGVAVKTGSDVTVGPGGLTVGPGGVAIGPGGVDVGPGGPGTGVAVANPWELTPSAGDGQGQAKPGPGDGQGAGPGEGQGPGAGEGESEKPAPGEGEKPAPGETPGQASGKCETCGEALAPGEVEGKCKECLAKAAAAKPGEGGEKPGQADGKCDKCGEALGLGEAEGVCKDCQAKEEGEDAESAGKIDGKCDKCAKKLGPRESEPLCNACLEKAAKKNQEELVVYLSCGDKDGPGKIYQLSKKGKILGIVDLPKPATGLAMHGDKGLVAAIPSDGGKVVYIDKKAKVETVFEKNKAVQNPGEVAMSANPDVMVVADNANSALMLTDGRKSRVFHRGEGETWDAGKLSLAVTRAKDILLGTSGKTGIFRFEGGKLAAPTSPILPGDGGVAADCDSLKWAATQPSNQVYVFEGGEIVKRLDLPKGKSMYGTGMIAFAEQGDVVVATGQGSPLFVQLDADGEKSRDLFVWSGDRVNDFVLGPPMPWEQQPKRRVYELGMGPGPGPGRGPGPGEGPGGPGPGPRGPGYPGPEGPVGPGGPGAAGADHVPLPIDKPKIAPAFVLYISCGDENGPGKVYQVDEHGRVLGIVNLPFTATGLALHRTNGLVCAIPRDGGKLLRIDDTAKVTTILEKDEALVHPVDVGIAAESDSMLVADNVSDLLAALNTGGGKPKVYQKFEGQKWDAQDMSVAITKDKHVIFGTNGNKGIFRFAGDDFTAKKGPVLPEAGGVAADTATLMWAATQPPNEVRVFEGEELVKKLTLPSGKRIYRNGLLSFAPAGSVVVAARPSDEQIGEVWLIQYETKNDEIRSLFPWNRERMVDFVVGPRMFWDRNTRPEIKSIY